MFSMAEKGNLVLPARLKCQKGRETMILSLNLFPCIFELLGTDSRTLYIIYWRSIIKMKGIIKWKSGLPWIFFNVRKQKMKKLSFMNGSYVFDVVQLTDYSLLILWWNVCILPKCFKYSKHEAFYEPGRTIISVKYIPITLHVHI